MLNLLRVNFSKILQPGIRRASGILSEYSKLESKQPPVTDNNETASISFYDPNVEPIISTKSYMDDHKFYMKPRQVWLENMDTIKEKKLGLVTLHPEIYGAQPRTDIIFENVQWQKMYRWIVSICSFFCSINT